MSKESYKGVPFSKKFRGVRTFGHYTDKEYRAFIEQMKKRLDEYFLDDCCLGVSTRAGSSAMVRVTTSKNGNTYEIVRLEDWRGPSPMLGYMSDAEYEYYALNDLLQLLDDDIVYMKERVSKIMNAVKNNQPLEGDEDDD